MTPPEEIHRTAREVFSRPEFHRDKSWIERFLDWLDRRLRLPGLSTGSGFGGGFGSLVSWIVFICLGVLLLWFVFRVLAGRRRMVRDEQAEAEVTVQELRPTGAWRSDAERAERDGDWKQAILCRYRELVGGLVDRDAISAVPGRTTGELRRDVDWSIPAGSGEFDRATLLFELAWYADEPTGPEQNRQFKELATAVLAAPIQRAVDDAIEVAA